MTNNHLEIIQQLAVPEYAPRPKPTPIPEAAWNDAPLFCLRVNGDWLSHIMGVLTALDQPDTWLGTDEEIEAARQQVNEIMLAFMDVCEEETVYPTHATMFHDESSVLTGGDLVRFSPASSPYLIPDHYYNFAAYQNTANEGDSFTQPFVLAAGDYSFGVLGLHNNVNGMVDWYVDDTLIVTAQDWYATGPEANIVKVNTVTISPSGLHTIKGVLSDTNEFSIAFGLPLTKYWFERVP